MRLLGGDHLVAGDLVPEAGVAPEAGVVYWVDTTILPAADPEDRRLVVVVEVPASVDGRGSVDGPGSVDGSGSVDGTVVVVSRSAVDDFGVEDVGDGGARFSRRHPVPRRLWTAATVTPTGRRLDDAVLAAVRARFTGR